MNAHVLGSGRAALIAVVLMAIYYANYVNGWITAADLDFYN